MTRTALPLPWLLEVATELARVDGADDLELTSDACWIMLARERTLASMTGPKNENKNEHAAALSKLGASKGGKARAEKLSAARKSEIGTVGAAARWNTPVETHGGDLHIGDVTLPCFVLNNGQRVLSLSGIERAFGSRRKGASNETSTGPALLPTFMRSKGVFSNIPSTLLEPLEKPISFRPKHGGRLAFGYEASILPSICEAILDARSNGQLRSNQANLAKMAETLLRGFARVGIVALVDEATGYQADRSRDALARILDKFIAKELQPWVRTFPAEFYEHMFRLRGWDWKGMKVNRPHAAALYTKDLVYARLAPGVLEELKKVTPRTADGRPKAKLFQSLTPDVGHPKLREHLASVVTLMKVSRNWGQFMDHMNHAIPKFNETIRLFPGDTGAGEVIADEPSGEIPEQEK